VRKVLGSAVAALLLPGGILLVTADPAYAAKRLNVSKTRGLSRGGETVTVKGSGYDVSKGIYVAFCVDNGAGVLPSPCGGGADMTGSSGSSAWISSNPPSYGEGLAKPYGSGGSFTVTVRVSQKIGDVDCVVRACAIVSRADHTRTSDRSQDVRVPILFAAPATAAGGEAPAAAPTAPAAVSVPKGLKSPAGPPTGRLATEAPSASAPAAVALDLPQSTLTRTSAATPLGHWWAIAGAFAAGIALTVLTGSLRRRRFRRSQGASA
jgi:hypothetical protein